VIGAYFNRQHCAAVLINQHTGRIQGPKKPLRGGFFGLSVSAKHFY